MSIADPNQAELSYAEPGETNPNGSSRRAALLPVDEFLINRISTAIESPKEWTKADTDEIITRLSAAEAEIEGALGLGWHDFLSLIFSVAMSTADDSAHRALCHVVFGLAKTIADDNEAETLKFVRNSPNFEEFSWIAKDLWDGKSRSYVSSSPHTGPITHRQPTRPQDLESTLTESKTPKAEQPRRRGSTTTASWPTSASSSASRLSSPCKTGSSTSVSAPSRRGWRIARWLPRAPSRPRPG